MALVRLLSTIKDTRSATPCPNSGESTPGATFKVAVEEASVEAEGAELSNCAAPTVPSFDVPDKERSVPLPCACRSAAPAPAVAEIACAIDAAVAAVTAELVAPVADAAAAGAAKPCGPPTAAAAPVSAAAEPLAMKTGSAGALVPWVMAAAMAAAESAGAAAAESAFAEAGPLSDVAVNPAVLPSDVGVEPAASAAAVSAAVLAALPSTGLALTAEFPAPAVTRAGVAAAWPPSVGAVAATSGVAEPVSGKT